MQVSLFGLALSMVVVFIAGYLFGRYKETDMIKCKECGQYYVKKEKEV